MEKLQKRIDRIKEILGHSNELIIKEIDVQPRIAILYMLGLNDTTALSKFVISPIQSSKESKLNIDMLKDSIITLSEMIVETDENKIIDSLLKGKGVLLLDGEKNSLILATDKYKERSVEEPPTSAVLKGPRSGFVENLKTNLSILRKILATPKLRTISTTVGKHTSTSITIVYIDGIAEQKVVETVKKRIDSINIDGVIDSHYIAGFLEEKPNSIFKQIGDSEKPDIVAAKMLEGRVAIIVDGSPLVLTVPFIYLEDFQSGDDYYGDHARATFLRWLRIASIFITILTPALYIAVVLHHYKAIPLKFLITIINTTKGLPLTPFAEILFVLILFEILYEASLRMPKYLGLALSIVGALILGDTAVKAGLISPPAVMIVAVSGLSIYCIPDQAAQLNILRLLFTLAGGMLGFFGVTITLLFVILYLNDFDSYGSPYFAPLAPFINSDIKDFIYKTDIVNMKYRPRSIAGNRKNQRRQGGSNGKDNIR